MFVFHPLVCWDIQCLVSLFKSLFNKPVCYLGKPWSYVHQNFPFVKKGRHTPFLKKMQLFVIHIFFSHFLKKDATLLPCYPPSCPTIHPPGYPLGYPPSYPSSYLMLPNLTSKFIKLSDGDLQYKWNFKKSPTSFQN